MSNTGYRRRLGDRKEGRRLRTLPALNLFEPYIMIRATTPATSSLAA